MWCGGFCETRLELGLCGQKRQILVDLLRGKMASGLFSTKSTDIGAVCQYPFPREQTMIVPIQSRDPVKSKDVETNWSQKRAKTPTGQWPERRIGLPYCRQQRPVMYSACHRGFLRLVQRWRNLSEWSLATSRVGNQPFSFLVLKGFLAPLYDWGPLVTYIVTWNHCLHQNHGCHALSPASRPAEARLVAAEDLQQQTEAANANAQHTTAFPKTSPTT